MKAPALSLPTCLIALVVPFLFIGCGGYQYVASPRYVPINEKKGDMNVNVSLAGAQLGYAFSNKFSIFATGFRRVPTHDSEFLGMRRPERYCKSKEINLGLTYFGKKGKFRYEVVAGGGMGDMAYRYLYHFDHYQDRSLDMQADKWNVYIQPNFSYKIHERVDRHLALAVFTKFNSVNYYNTIVTDYVWDVSINRYTKVQVTGLSPQPRNGDRIADGFVYFSNHEKSNSFFIEPGIFVKAGAKNFKGLAQLSYVINAGGPSLYYLPYSITLGCAINFNVFD